jgi:hypothetical protein
VLGRCVAIGQVKGLAFGCGDEVVCVHYYTVVFGEEAHLLRFEGAGRGLGQGYLLEGFLEEGQRRGIRGGVKRRGDQAAGHLFGASSGRDQAYPDFDEAHVCLAGCDDAV